jgi:hypothetical protein
LDRQGLPVTLIPRSTFVPSQCISAAENAAIFATDRSGRADRKVPAGRRSARHRGGRNEFYLLRRLAIALVDELEEPQHIRQRLIIGY